MTAHAFSFRKEFLLISIISLGLIFLISGCTSPEPTDWYVSNTGSDSNSCKTPEQACLTIQEAVEKAWKTGDHINIAAGEYSEKVLIEGKSIAISGQGPNTTRISGSNLCTAGDDDALVSIFPKDNVHPEVLIENLAIRDCKRGDFRSSITGGGINAFSLTLTLKDVLITGNSAFHGAGIFCNACELNILYSTISKNSANGNGGGIYSKGTIFLGASSIRENNAQGNGGGLWWDAYKGKATLTDMVIRENEARDNGGGIYSTSNPSKLIITKSTIDGNSARGGGGLNVASLTEIYESTISNNSALGAGGGISNENQLFMVNCTISGNQKLGVYVPAGETRLTLINVTLANNGGKGIFMVPGGVAVVEDTLLVSNGAANCDIRSSVSASGNIATDQSCPGAALETEPKIGPLSNNGGSTNTHSLLPDSPAIDTAQAGNGSVWQDQRTNVRPYDGDGDGEALNDVGAVEFVFLGGVSTLSAPTDSPISFITNQNMNCRTGPGTDWNTGSVLAGGTTVPVTGRNANGTWVQVEMSDGTICWVFVTHEISGIEKVPVLPDPPKPFRPTEITAPPPSLSKNCSKYTSTASCTSAGCTWVFSSVGLGKCK